MVKITDKIKADRQERYFSFEFFPPKTEAGVQNLYSRIERMVAMQPLFVDITWGAGGCTRDLSTSIADHAQTYLGAVALLHLTLSDLTVSDLKEILKKAKDAGIMNILALRGDPAKGAHAWKPCLNGLENAIDLVRLIREEHGDYFCIGVAGFPEGHPYATADVHRELEFLKQKIDAGADFILTQFFYNPDNFLSYSASCREIGIACPIIPGIMPIQSFSSFKRMTTFCKTQVPDKMWEDLAPIKGDDEEVKAYGIRSCVEMCNYMAKAGVRFFHFHTLNLEKSVMCILKELSFCGSIASRRALPWGCSRTNLKGAQEDVRPINWANRPKAYVKRTITWDEFPNGRWGDNRSPAFGDLSDTRFYRPLEGSKSDLLAIWGQAPITSEDVYEVFARYVEGKIPIIPWCESGIHQETKALATQFAALNRAGILTINSQPAVNGVRSDDALYGWGGPGGRVYQKAYVEFFVEPNFLALILQVVAKHHNLSLYAIDCNKTLPVDDQRGVTALTWGVFPDKEIQQPTIFDPDIFALWSEEVFELWTRSWAALYDDSSESSDLLYHIHDTYVLVAIVDNDYVESTLLKACDEILAAKKYAASKKELNENGIEF